MGKLRVDISPTPLAGDHKRLFNISLRRGKLRPDRRPGEKLAGRYSRQILEVAANTWKQRMLHEHNSSAVFSRLLPQLIEAQAPIDVKTAALRGAIDELRHAALCAQVVEFLGGSAEVEGELRTRPLPEHEDGDAKERALRNVLFVGCLSETSALAMLTQEREGTKEPFIARVLTQLAADEVLHAKFGWAYIGLMWPHLSATARRRTNRYLRVALGAIEAEMHRALPPMPRQLSQELSTLGILPSRRAMELFYDTMRTVTLPRLQAVGLDAVGGWVERVVPGRRRR